MRALERRIAKLEAAVAKEHSHAITIWNQWFEIFEQLQKECDRMVAEAVKGGYDGKRPSVQKDSATLPLKK